MTLSIFRLLARAALTSLLVIGSAHAQTAASSAAPIKLRIGYQKSSTLITILKARGSLERALAS